MPGLWRALSWSALSVVPVDQGSSGVVRQEAVSVGTWLRLGMAEVVSACDSDAAMVFELLRNR